MVNHDPNPVHSNTAAGKQHCTLLNVAVQTRLTAAFDNYNYTYKNHPPQVCSEPAQMHCSIALGKMQFPLFSGARKTGSHQACVTAKPPPSGDLLFILVAFLSDEHGAYAPIFTAAWKSPLQ